MPYDSSKRGAAAEGGLAVSEWGRFFMIMSATPGHAAVSAVIFGVELSWIVSAMKIERGSRQSHQGQKNLQWVSDLSSPRIRSIFFWSIRIRTWHPARGPPKVQHHFEDEYFQQHFEMNFDKFDESAD
jgi:hypothetical protein